MRTLLIPSLGLLLFACGHGEDFGSSERPAPSTTIGAACLFDNDCDQYCALGRAFPGGFCTYKECRSNDECPEGTVCIREDGGICLYPCAVPADCASSFLGRGGYTCKFRNGYASSADTSGVSYKVCIGD
jgi:hypothetical protein